MHQKLAAIPLLSPIFNVFLSLIRQSYNPLTKRHLENDISIKSLIFKETIEKLSRFGLSMSFAFNLRFSFSELPHCLGEWSSLIGTIESPDIPSYTNEVSCRWVIRTNKHYGLVLSFNLPWKNNGNCHSYLTLKSERNGSYKPRSMKICSKADITQEMDLKTSSVTIEYHAKVLLFGHPFLRL